MTFRNLMLGAAAFAMLASPTFAEEFLGGLVQTSEVGGQTILTNADGMTLYIWDNDDPGVSNCYDQCAVNWPPLWAPADTEVTGEFTLVDRTDATGDNANMKIVAYKGMPLYLWVKDTKPGDTTGDGVGGTWHTAVF